MLPNLALVGAYTFSNPNMYNGFKTKFNGAFSVGAMLTIPIWHWGGNYNKYRSAKVDETIMKLQIEDAKEKIDLQVSQASFKAGGIYHNKKLFFSIVILFVIHRAKNL